MIDPTMNITFEDAMSIVSGISDDGTISKDAEKAILAGIEKGKAMGLPLLEVKRQFRCKIGPVEGKKLAEAVGKLWYAD
ncbi:MAG: hypothetical protein IJG48_08105 [Mogibacterium sp.]|nr:hypothetical protein [Mogibacterium sp.]